MSSKETTFCPWCDQPTHAVLRNTTTIAGRTWHTLCHEESKLEDERRAARGKPHEASPLALLRDVCKTIVDVQRRYEVIVLVALLPQEQGFNVRVVSKNKTGGRQHGIERTRTFREIELANFDLLSRTVTDMAKEIGERQ